MESVYEKAWMCAQAFQADQKHDITIGQSIRWIVDEGLNQIVVQIFQISPVAHHGTKEPP